MTGSWLTLSAAASRIADVTGKPVSVDDIHRLADANELQVSWLHDHYGVLKSSLAAYLSTLPASELDASRGALLAESKPTVRGGPVLPFDIEDEFQRRKDDA
ncbi:hypothetical protein [Nonomuraea sp. NPDC048901]|uniref:hypothetical protein n=1 Tax=Nonomuraea sp. NPDC048901 TaxID=3155627 RepID=UPI0033E6FC03